MIADYFFVRRCKLDVDGLYSATGPYKYSNGIHWQAMLALAAGIAVAVSTDWLYNYAWFVGFAVAAIVYAVATPRAMPASNPSSPHA